MNKIAPCSYRFSQFYYMQQKEFTKRLLKWHKEHNNRQMPWKGEKDPYKVWLSEIILQQTRVEQGLPYYEKFIKKYPTIDQLAKADDETVFKLWEGLGYYTRCKNLLHTARFIVHKYNGMFPDNYQDVSALKGVGPYTAAAICSFCFNLPYAVLDGNVFRILSRVFGNETPVDSKEGKKIFQQMAGELLDKKKPALFNQAIMDFGATQCKPMLPLCAGCSLNEICVAFNQGTVNKLPFKEKVLSKKVRWFSYIVFECDGKILIRKRKSKDIWQNLFEFYLIETPVNPGWTSSSIEALIHDQLAFKDFRLLQLTIAAPQQLTHQHIKGYFIKVLINKIPAILTSGDDHWMEAAQINRLPFPGYINAYLRNKKSR